MKTQLFTKYFAMLICISFMGCQSGNQDSEETEEKDTASMTKDTVGTKQGMDKDQSSSLILPSPLQIATIFKESGLSYMNGVPNDPDNASNYISSSKRLMNLGIYSADLSYCILNEQSQQAGQYLNTVRSLAKKVGMAGVFESEKMFEKFEQNLGNRDSAMKIMTRIQQNIDTYLNENDQADKSMTIFTGAWVEGMYIGVKAIENNDNQTLTTRLIEQLTLLEDVLDKLNDQSGHSESMKNVITQLEDLDSKFQDFVKEKRQQMDSESGVSVEYKEMKSLAEQIKKIRNQMVEA